MVVIFYGFLVQERERRLRFPAGWRWMIPDRHGRSRPYIRAAAMGVAHGFIVRGKNLIAPNMPVPGPPQPPGQIRGLVKMTLNACVWAACMTMGMLVYQHFLRRWEERGLPVLPVAALTTVGQTLGRMSAHGVPLGPSSAYERSSDRQREPTRPMSLIDEYEG